MQTAPDDALGEGRGYFCGFGAKAEQIFSGLFQLAGRGDKKIFVRFNKHNFTSRPDETEE